MKRELSPGTRKLRPALTPGPRRLSWLDVTIFEAGPNTSVPGADTTPPTLVMHLVAR